MNVVPSSDSRRCNDSQATNILRKTPHHANRVAARSDQLNSVAGCSYAVIDMETQLSMRPNIPTKDEAHQAAELALQYFQGHLDSLSSHELNFLYQIRERLQ
ncbi:hypothetical protein N7509_012730 [Penicillium cosmopolitanum]|uniref:Uncharacterized protein n=1 Tax=Penicillium cosmopolitanum TaxID=1131564 RepID=A0A9W9SJ82_9EURO|nr:uncharacterized protein N7509_012730 [Penicillium cosmopolitanum]KAJ5379611.1 hypothetical protein N7509_012730 [Penicillium cosmopolitanum]